MKTYLLTCATVALACAQPLAAETLIFGQTEGIGKDTQRVHFGQIVYCINLALFKQAVNQGLGFFLKIGTNLLYDLGRQNTR